eukprot:8711341-Pyramimonas_sp.AAC.1
MDSSPKVKETLERVVYDKDTAPVSLEPVLDAVKETVISALESLGLTAEGSPNVAHEVRTFGEAHDTGTRPEQSDMECNCTWPIDKTELYPSVAHEVRTSGEAHDTECNCMWPTYSTECNCRWPINKMECDCTWPIDKTELQNGDTKH